MTDLSDVEIDETLPEVVQEFLRNGGELETITLHANGRWSHEGGWVENQKVSRLFSKSVARTQGGTWVLKIWRFTYPITVEDTGFFIEHVDLFGDTPSMTLSDETHEDLDSSTLRYEGDGFLTCRVKDGAFRARFLRQPYYKLMQRVEERDGVIALPIGGEVVALAYLDDRPVGDPAADSDF